MENGIRKRLKRSWMLWLLSKIWPWLLLIGLALFLRTFIRIGISVGPSMEPTLHTGDILLIARWIEPQEGDIVAARAPGIEYSICKRVAGISQDGYYLLGDNSSNSLDTRLAAEIIANGDDDTDLMLAVLKAISEGGIEKEILHRIFR